VPHWARKSCSLPWDGSSFSGPWSSDTKAICEPSWHLSSLPPAGCTFTTTSLSEGRLSIWYEQRPLLGRIADRPTWVSPTVATTARLLHTSLLALASGTTITPVTELL